MSAPTSLDVHLADGDHTRRVGTAYFTVRRGQVTSRFEYDAGFLSWPASFDLSPHIRRSERGVTTAGLPGALADSAPDRWGRQLIRRRVHAAAHATGTAPPSVTEVDFLVGVSDLTRQGALRLSEREGASFLAPGADVPRLIELPALLAATRTLAGDGDDLAAVKTLLAAGSASLGGARPKASVRDGGSLSIAKFPHQADEWDVMAWEATALQLAARCGIATPTHRLESVSNASVLLLERFDRVGNVRIPYISAMTLLDRTDGQPADYIEVAEALATHGAHVSDDLRELWRRIALSIAINNTDDHLRNHGFLHGNGGWMLAPLFDVNPNPIEASPRVTSVGGATDRVSGLTNLVAVAATFELDRAEAVAAWLAIREVVADWRTVASANGISSREQRRFAPVLDATARMDA
jgi:serine/threonine-protein kinase HipA